MLAQNHPDLDALPQEANVQQVTDTGQPDTNAVETRPGPKGEKSGRRAQFRREERREVRYMLSVGLAVWFSWVFWLLPVRVRNFIADRGGEYFYRRSQTYRDNVRANLRQVLPAETSDEELSAAAEQVFRVSARNFMDLVLTPRIRPETFVANVPLVSGDWSTLDRALAEGRGGVLVTAHLGAFDYIGQTLFNRGYKLTTVTGRTTARFVFDGVTYLRRSHGNAIVEATPSGVRRVMQALRRGEFAAFVTDRDFFQNGKPVVFFGRPTTLPPGAVRIARDTGAPIIPVFARRTATGYAMSVHEPFTVQKTSDLEGDIARGMDALVQVLEPAIAATPDQWVMFQRVWPTEPVDPVRVFPVGSPLESELLERFAAVLPGPRSPQKGDPGGSPGEEPSKGRRVQRPPLPE